MCRADIAPDARQQLARVLADIAAAIATQDGSSPADVRIGPVDFGPMGGADDSANEIPCGDSCWHRPRRGVGTEDGTRRPPGWEWTDR